MLSLTNMNNFYTPEVVGCGSETQLEVGESLYKITWQVKC